MMQLLNQWGPWLIAIFAIYHAAARIEKRLDQIEGGVQELQGHLLPEDDK